LYILWLFLLVVDFCFLNTRGMVEVGSG